jgi:hypothetical protein
MICGSDLHGMTVTRPDPTWESTDPNCPGINFFCPITTTIKFKPLTEQASPSTYRPCPLLLATHYGFQEDELRIALMDLKTKGYGRFTTMETMKKFEEEVMRLCEIEKLANNFKRTQVTEPQIPEKGK